MVASCSAFWIILGDDSKEYPDLTSCEFLSIYLILQFDKSLCSFQALALEKHFVTLEKCYSSLKDWYWHFFFISSEG